MYHNFMGLFRKGVEMRNFPLCFISTYKLYEFSFGDEHIFIKTNKHKSQWGQIQSDKNT